MQPPERYQAIRYHWVRFVSDEKLHVMEWCNPMLCWIVEGEIVHSSMVDDTYIAPCIPPTLVDIRRQEAVFIGEQMFQPMRAR